jgi:hypothetical protein
MGGKTMKPYCTQNNGDCKTCSLVSYNRDCQNNPLKGGPGKGQGRKPTGRKRQQYYVTDEEDTLLRSYIDQLRKPSEYTAGQSLHQAHKGGEEG